MKEILLMDFVQVRVLSISLKAICNLFLFNLVTKVNSKMIKNMVAVSLEENYKLMGNWKKWK